MAAEVPLALNACFDLCSDVKQRAYSQRELTISCQTCTFIWLSWSCSSFVSALSSYALSAAFSLSFVSKARSIVTKLHRYARVEAMDVCDTDASEQINNHAHISTVGVAASSHVSELGKETWQVPAI